MKTISYQAEGAVVFTFDLTTSNQITMCRSLALYSCSDNRYCLLLYSLVDVANPSKRLDNDSKDSAVLLDIRYNDRPEADVGKRRLRAIDTFQHQSAQKVRVSPDELMD